MGGTRLRKLLLGSALLLAVTSCGAPREDSWYPHYSTFWARHHDRPIVFIHGFGGSFDTFRDAPFRLGLGSGRGLFYFGYETGPFLERANHISRVAADLRAFLDGNIFRHNAAARVDIIAHSTGGLIARDYVANNPYSHRVNKLVLVGVPNYGAYWAFLKAEVLQRYASFYQGDLQAKELDYGSHSLFFLQRRWDCLYAYRGWLEKQFPASGEKGEKVDPARLERWAEQRRELVSIRKRNKELEREKKPEPPIPPDLQSLPSPPDCMFDNGFLGPEEAPHDGLVVLPKIIAAVGTKHGREALFLRFSDGVVRWESGILDERFLDKHKKQGGEELPAIFYVDSAHWLEEGYFQAGSAEVLHIAWAFLQKGEKPRDRPPFVVPGGDPPGRPCAGEFEFGKLVECYAPVRERVEGTVGVSAYWARLTDHVAECRDALRESDPEVTIRLEDGGKDAEVASPLLETLLQGGPLRERRLFTNDSWIRYERYVRLGEDARGDPLKKREFDLHVSIAPRAQTGQKIDFRAKVSLRRGRTAVVECLASRRACYDLTADAGQDLYLSEVQKDDLKKHCQQGRLFTHPWVPPRAGP